MRGLSRRKAAERFGVSISKRDPLALAERGIGVAVSTLWQVFGQHRIMLKKHRACCRAEPS